MKNQPFLKRVTFASQGVFHALKHESSFRTQLVIAALAVCVFAYLHAPVIWWALLLVMMSLVLSLELVNTALENALDHLHPEFHSAIRVAKDCAAAAVWLACLGSVGVFIAFLIATRS